MPFPNSPNARLELLKVEKDREWFKVLSRREVIGIVRSLTRDEWKTAIETKVNISIKVSVNAFVYKDEKFVKIENKYYKIERTFVGGQYIELYLGETSLQESDFV